jgi:hypothetical protein
MSVSQELQAGFGDSAMRQWGFCRRPFCGGNGRDPGRRDDLYRVIKGRDFRCQLRKALFEFLFFILERDSLFSERKGIRMRIRAFNTQFLASSRPVCCVFCTPLVVFSVRVSA